jgi:protein-tyrosine phosphatase
MKIPILAAKNAARMGHPQAEGHPSADRKTRRRRGMDITWMTDRIAVGGGIWNADNMAKVVAAEITHIIDMQREFDDTALASECGVEVLWNATDDDFESKPAELFQHGVEFAQKALEGDGKIFIHCAAGVHRAPMMAAALLATMGWSLEDAMRLIVARRPVADFPEVYVRSMEEFLNSRENSLTTEDRERQ